MIRQLVVEGVTVFPSEKVFRFVPGINIIIGGNDSGKSHLMKLCYALTKWAGEGNKRGLPDVWAEEKRLRKDLLRVFGTHTLGALTSLNRGNNRARVQCSMQGEAVPAGTAETHFDFCADREEEGLHMTRVPDRYLKENAVFISPREILSIYPCYMQAGKRYPELLDSASWELCRALEVEPPKDMVIPGALRHVIRQVENLLNGRLQRRHGRFFLERAQQQPMELNLVAEGFKRIGTLALLIGNGTIRKGTSLFWDEPEMNLNASHLPRLVGMMMTLCRAGVQLTLTTHSLFLLRELVIQLGEKANAGVSRLYVGLQPSEDNTQGVRTSTGCSLDELDHIASLDAEQEQADRYLNIYTREEEV